MWRLCLACCLGLLLGPVAMGYTDGQRNFPFSSEHWEGWRRWTPDQKLQRDWKWPRNFTVDRSGKCEVRCERSGRSYRCKEYRC